MITTNMAMQLNYQGLHLYLCCQSRKVSNLPMSKKELIKEKSRSKPAKQNRVNDIIVLSKASSRVGRFVSTDWK